MKRENQYEKSLRLLEKWFSETSENEIKITLQKYDMMKFEGPTITEYFALFGHKKRKWFEFWK